MCRLPRLPAEATKLSEARVWAGALLSGPDTIVIAAANHIPASKPDPPAIEPARNVTITVQLPPYLEDVQGFEEHRSLVLLYGKFPWS